MGIFSYVTLEVPCPYCGYVLNDFQSKDGKLMEYNDPWTLSSFYTSCPKCKNWVEYDRKDTVNIQELLQQGLEATNLLKLIKNELKASSTLSKLLEKYLKKCKYPDDTTKWLDLYELKRLI